MLDFDLLLYNPMLVLGLLVALALALAALAWVWVGRAEQRAACAAEMAALNAAFAQLTATDAALSARRDMLEAVIASLPAALELRDAAGRVLLRNARAEDFRDLCPDSNGDWAPSISRLKDGRLVAIRRAAVRGGGSVALVFEVDGRGPMMPTPVLATPVMPEPGPPPVAVVDPARALHTLRRQRRALVLLVEDIPVNQVVTATALQRAGMHVEIAASGAEALRKVAHAPYEIVLMDLMMPGMSGYEAARAIRTLPGMAGRVPIYALTATASQADRTRCRDVGMQGMLTKPVQPNELAELLEGILRPTTFRPAPRAVLDPDRLLDAVRLAELQRGLPDGMFIELVEQALGDMGARLGALHAALLGDDPAVIVVEAHALAGIAGSYGMVAFDRQMRGVLAAASGADVGAARQAADGMAAALDGSAAALRAMVRPAAARPQAAGVA